VPIRKRALVQSRGGLSTEPCQWAGCHNRALVGLAYCDDCAYERAGIRE
jgi:hypothetical protein